MKAIRTKLRKSDLEREERPKSGPRSDFQKVHNVRNLRELVKADLTRLYGVGMVSDCSDELVDAVVTQVRHWLLDHVHARVMARRHAETPVINDLISSLGETDVNKT